MQLDTHLSDSFQLGEDGVLVLLRQGSSQHLIYLLQGRKKSRRCSKKAFSQLSMNNFKIVENIMFLNMKAYNHE